MNRLIVRRSSSMDLFPIAEEDPFLSCYEELWGKYRAELVPPLGRLFRYCEASLQEDTKKKVHLVGMTVIHAAWHTPKAKKVGHKISESFGQPCLFASTALKELLTQRWETEALGAFLKNPQVSKVIFFLREALDKQEDSRVLVLLILLGSFPNPFEEPKEVFELERMAIGIACREQGKLLRGFLTLFNSHPASIWKLLLICTENKWERALSVIHSFLKENPHLSPKIRQIAHSLKTTSERALKEAILEASWYVEADETDEVHQEMLRWLWPLLKFFSKN